MIRALTILLALGGTAGGQTTCEAPSKTLPEPTLRLRVYNVADASQKTLNRALEIAGSVFASANIRICWEHGDTDAAEAHYTDMTGRLPASISRRMTVIIWR